MILLGSIVNFFAIIIGGGVGTLAGKNIAQRYSDIVVSCLALFTFYMGMSNILATKQPLIVIVSLIAGSLIGEWLNIDKAFHNLGDKIQSKIARGKASRSGEAFVTASLVFCIGSMAIMGGMQSGLLNNHNTLYTKSFLDGVFSVFFASTMGLGVCLSAFPVFIYQGSITILSSFLVPYLSTAVVLEMSATGGILLMALSLGMLNIKDIKVANMIPAMFLPILFMMFI